MKKTLSLLLSVCLIFGTVAFAAPSPSPKSEDKEKSALTATETPVATKIPEKEEEITESPSPSPTADVSATPTLTPKPDERTLSKEFVLTMAVNQMKYIQSRNAIIELYDMEDKLLGSCLRYVGWDTPTVTFNYDVPEYQMGTKFKIKLVDGLRSIWYYDQGAAVGETLTVETYGYLNDEGEYIQNNGATINAKPHFDKEVHLYINGEWHNDMEPHARIIDDVLMAPVRAVGEAMGLYVFYEKEKDGVSLYLEDHVASFTTGSTYMFTPAGDRQASHAPVYVEGSLFVPVRDLAEAYDCKLEVTDYGEFIDVLIGEAPYLTEILNRIPVNRDGIGSKTNYLIWVSKHEYKVRVYEGQQYHWHQLKEFPCALGAWGTPTITGQFEILERTQWNYGSYYVGPVLRFYNGYALHSTLLNYGGGEYDGRVGVNISHGCVRLHPGDINWIAATVPFHSRVYITE